MNRWSWSLIGGKDMEAARLFRAGPVDRELAVLVGGLGLLQALGGGELASSDPVGLLDEPLGLGAELGGHRRRMEDEPAVPGGAGKRPAVGRRLDQQQRML